eukprot:6259636-Alexandrium_andersonii.AAC.1
MMRQSIPGPPPIPNPGAVGQGRRQLGPQPLPYGIYAPSKSTAHCSCIALHMGASARGPQDHVLGGTGVDRH